MAASGGWNFWERRIQFFLGSSFLQCRCCTQQTTADYRKSECSIPRRAVQRLERRKPRPTEWQRRCQDRRTDHRTRNWQPRADAKMAVWPEGKFLSSTKNRVEQPLPGLRSPSYKASTTVILKPDFGPELVEGISRDVSDSVATPRVLGEYCRERARMQQRCLIHSVRSLL